MSDEHFTVDGTLIEAWASQKSFQPKDGPPSGDGRDFRGQQRRNDTHASKTDPDAKLYRRTQHGEARLAYLGHLLIENRHGLIVDAMATQADGTAERDAAMLMLDGARRQAPWRRRTIGADKSYDTRDFVAVVRELGVTPHVTQNVTRTGGSAIDGRTTRHPGYAQPTRAAADRASVRLVEDHRLVAEGEAARVTQGRLAPGLRRGRVQPETAAEAVGDAGREAQDGNARAAACAEYHQSESPAVAHAGREIVSVDALFSKLVGLPVGQ
jgi:hypothetical protein